MSVERQLPRTEEVALFAAAQRTVEELAGTILLERYRLIELCGAGGASVVYRAEHSMMQKPVAVKILRPELALRPDFVQRFLSEARTVARLRHEHIVDIVDIGRTEGGVVFCVMEWLEGAELGDTLEREGPLPWPRARHIVLQVCQALAAAHGAGVVHRDIKPQNCFRVRRGADPDFIKLLDFGIAKQLDQADGLTATGMVIGTAEYMSPEQARAQAVDARSDIYSLGAMLFELLSGRPPFEGQTFVDVLIKQAHETPPKLSTLVPALPSAFDEIVAVMLAKNPADRFASVEAVAKALLHVHADRNTFVGVLHGAPMDVRPESMLGKGPASGSITRRFGRSANLLIVVAIATTLALVLGIAWFVEYAGRDPALAGDDGARSTPIGGSFRQPDDEGAAAVGTSSGEAEARQVSTTAAPPAAKPPDPVAAAPQPGVELPPADSTTQVPSPPPEPPLVVPPVAPPADKPVRKPSSESGKKSHDKWKRELKRRVEKGCTFFGATDITVTKAAGKAPVIKAAQAMLRECVAKLVPGELPPGTYPIRVTPPPAD